VIAGGVTKLTVKAAFLVVSATDVAVTVAVLAAVILEGAL
jgi:hypothetical protein